MAGAGARISLCHVLEATAGGTRQHLMDACLGLPPERFRQTAVISTLRDPSFEADLDSLREAGVEVEVVQMVREIDRESDLRAYRELKGFFADHPFDIIHAHSSKAGMLGRLAAWRSGNRAARVYSPHAFAFQMDVTRLRRRMFMALERGAGRITDLLICTCESERDIALRSRIMPPGRAGVVRTGVDLSRFHPQANARRVREELDLPGRHRIVGAVGALTEQKGHRYLIEAAPLVLERMPHTTFVICGPGELEDELRARSNELGIGRRIRFLGHRDDTPRVYAALDLFVLPSLWEGLPYALIEAMAVGVPVVGTEITGVTDVIDPGKTGWLTPPADAEGLAETIVAALGQEGLSARMAQAAREMVVRGYSRESMLEALQAYYERLMEDRTS